MNKFYKTQAMKPGQWVRGHKAIFFGEKFNFIGEITDVSASEKTVWFLLNPVLGAFARVTKPRAFTWREKSQRWIERGESSRTKAFGLALIKGASQ